MTGVRRSSRAPFPIYRPGSVFFQAGMLLIFTFSMMLAGISEAYLARDWIWFAFFITGATGCVILYFWNVSAWLRWMDHSAEYTPIDASLDSRHEDSHYPGEG